MARNLEIWVWVVQGHWKWRRSIDYNIRVPRPRMHRGVLGQEERPHHPIAPGPSLVARPGACQVQVMCVGLPVSARHGTVVPRRRPPADFRCWYPPSTPVC